MVRGREEGDLGGIFDLEGGWGGGPCDDCIAAAETVTVSGVGRRPGERKFSRLGVCVCVCVCVQECQQCPYLS